MIKTSLLGILVPLVCLSPFAAAQTVIQNQLPSPDGLLGVDDAAITPDGNHIVVRDNTLFSTARVYDAHTGAELAQYHSTSGFTLAGVAVDAVAVTNSRAVVIGSDCQIIDLSTPGTSLLAAADVGWRPRDLEITPDGTMVAIRGGFQTGSLANGGLYVFDLATATQLAQAPGEPTTWPSGGPGEFDVDSVSVTNNHAAFLSVVGQTSTRVTIMDLHPSGGGAPDVAYETGTGTDLDLLGIPHDLAITPDGKYVAVRSGMAVGLFRLDGPNTHLVWMHRLHGSPGPFGASAMDSVEVTNDRIATISRFSNGFFGAQVDIFDIAGHQVHEVIDGDPHDLAITPSGGKLLVRTHTHLYMYNLANLGGGDNIHYISRRPQLSTHTSYGAGYDSILVTEDKAVSVARVDETATIKFFDIRNHDLQLLANYTMPARPVDVTITPSGGKVVISGFSRVEVYDFETYAQLLAYVSNPGGGYPWCDGVVANDQTAIAMGSTFNGPAGSQAAGGWLTIVDLFDQPSVYCNSNANSTGDVGQLYATGSASVASNNLHLVAHDLPKARFGVFLLGDGQVNTPFGNGVLCVGGQASSFPIQTIGSNRMAELSVDSMNLPTGSPALTVGGSANFQFLFRDTQAGPGQMNSTGGLQVLFTL